MKSLSFFLLLLVPILVCGLDFVPNQIIIKTTQPMEVQQRSMGIAAMDAALQSWEVVSLKPVFRAQTTATSWPPAPGILIGMQPQICETVP